MGVTGFPAIFEPLSPCWDSNPYLFIWVAILAVFYFLGLAMGPGVAIRIN